jgi:DNA-binding transcriptional LysR family regulator
MGTTAVDYHLLAAFVAVAEESSFSKAARRLGITKGTVSRAIARLEDVVGAELIHRNTHKVALSTAGTALYERTAPHLTALDGAVGTMPERSEQPSGELRITAPHDFAAIVLPELVAQFLVRFPDVRVDIRVSNARFDLVAERFDLAVRASMGRLADSTLTARRLSVGSAAGYYASPSYLARRGEPRAFGDPKHEWVAMPAMLKLVRVPKNFRPRVLVDDMLTLRNLVRDGAGIGILPRFVTEAYVAEGRLTAIMPSHTIGAANLHIVYPSSGQVPRKVTAFRDFLVERLKAGPLATG